MTIFSFSRLLIIILVMTTIVIAYEIGRIYYYIRISAGLVAEARPYILTGSHDGISLLVLGDSTAVGVGADTPSDSIAGRLAKHIGATRIENHGVSGAIVTDIGSQLESVEKKEYDYILLQIGANDMVAMHDIEVVSANYTKILESLPKTKKLIVLSCGNLGGAKLFPRIIGALYERISRQYHAKLSNIVANHGGIYVNLFEERSVDPFVLEPDIYLAADYFHPSSSGYGIWFNKLVKIIDSNK